MAPVNKHKTTKSKKQPVRRSQAGKRNQPKKGFPYIAFLGAVLLMGFIGYFMFAVDKPKEVPKAVVKQPSVKVEEQLPEKPQPKWEYESMLKNKEVVVDIPEEKKSTRPYQMQCGSFRHKDDAESLKAKIAFQGLNSIVKHTGNWYRVILGPFERKRLAEKQRHQLQRAKINGCQIWYWR